MIGRQKDKRSLIIRQDGMFTENLLTCLKAGKAGTGEREELTIYIIGVHIIYTLLQLIDFFYLFINRFLFNKKINSNKI